MTARGLDERASLHFTWRQLLHAGETWAALEREGRAPANLPLEFTSWVSLGALAKRLLDPLRERFGALEIMYGFASHELTRHIKGRIDPALDQHAAAERRKGQLICPRGGAAVDVIVPGTSSREVAIWVTQSLPYDRLYFYGDDRPIHISYSQHPSRSLVEMVRSPTGRLIPRRAKELR